MALYRRKDSLYVYERGFFDNSVDFKLVLVLVYYGLSQRALSDRKTMLQKILQKDNIKVYWVLTHELDNDTKDHHSPLDSDDQFVLPF